MPQRVPKRLFAHLLIDDPQTSSPEDLGTQAQSGERRSNANESDASQAQIPGR